MSDFKVGDIFILNSNAVKGLPSRIGERVTIADHFISSPNYELIIEFDDGNIAPAKKSELTNPTQEDLKLMEYIFTGNKVKCSGEEVVILTVDYLNGQAEVQFNDKPVSVVDFNKLSEIENGILPVIDFPKEYGGVSKHTIQLEKFTTIGLQIGKFTDEKNKQYGSSVDATYEMIKVLMERYKNEDNTYTIPESLLQHILLQVRMMDKQNRIFNNPSGEGDSESPYKDLAGYSLIGIDIVSK